MGVSMAAKLRHWKEKDGRYWARIAIPVELKPLFNNKTQLTEPLGGDRRLAERNHPAAVARLQEQLDAARRTRASSSQATAESPAPPAAVAPRRAIAQDDLERAAWDHYTATLALDAEKRNAMPTSEEINAAKEEGYRRVQAGEADPDKSIAGFFNAFTDYELKAGARHFDAQHRARKLNALRAEVSNGGTRLVDAAVQEFVDLHNLAVIPGTRDWNELAHRFMRAEIEALERTLEIDDGNFKGAPSDPIIRPPTKNIEAPETVDPVSLTGLFEAYIGYKQALGKHMDGGATGMPRSARLSTFLATMMHVGSRTRT